MLIKLTSNIAVNPVHVVSARIEHHERDTRLVVEVVTGSLIRVTHNLHERVDVYGLHQALLAAKVD
ncbi:hypothetical protein [Burkholderia perseverans]|uniref:hypothetical protein n=1 Tax=Burkholderia perseverans TaxID=2615214 RepID=UPI001FEFFB94|nr:hypothetical protein [Burkholderia perseverans]